MCHVVKSRVIAPVSSIENFHLRIGIKNAVTDLLISCIYLCVYLFTVFFFQMPESIFLRPMSYLQSMYVTGRPCLIVRIIMHIRHTKVKKTCMYIVEKKDTKFDNL